MALSVYYSGRGKFMPLPPKSMILRHIDLWSQRTLKCFRDKFGRCIGRPLSWCNRNCQEFVIKLLAVPQRNKFSVPIFLKKKEISLLLVKKKSFQLKRNVI